MKTPLYCLTPFFKFPPCSVLFQTNNIISNDIQASALHIIRYYNIYKGDIMIIIKTVRTIYIGDIVHHIWKDYLQGKPWAESKPLLRASII